jgi:catechol 2,3-dioxygenase-like lactoylglutathione lyase family enzyme
MSGMLGCLGMQVQRLSHIGICVTDLEASVVFYRDALGFSELSRLEVSGSEPERLLELKDVALHAVYLERDGTRIELLHFDSPGETGGPGPRPVNQTGLTHLSFRVTSLDDTIAAVESRGGQVLESTRIQSPRYETSAIFVTDPDGLRIELLESPGDPNALPGAAP